MDKDIILRIKEKEYLEIIKYIAFVYAIFLFAYALILGYEETIIEATFILIFSVIINVFNYGELLITEKGISADLMGFVKYSEIYRTEFKDKILYVYTRKLTKPIKIIFAENEDSKLIEKSYRYIDSKVKKIEEDIKEHEEYIKKYL